MQSVEKITEKSGWIEKLGILVGLGDEKWIPKRQNRAFRAAKFILNLKKMTLISNTYSFPSSKFRLIPFRYDLSLMNSD